MRAPCPCQAAMVVRRLAILRFALAILHWRQNRRFLSPVPSLLFPVPCPLVPAPLAPLPPSDSAATRSRVLRESADWQPPAVLKSRRRPRPSPSEPRQTAAAPVGGLEPRRSVARWNRGRAVAA